MRKVHKCEARGCGRIIATPTIMCATHWYMVPRELREVLIRLWRKGAPSKDYLAALVAARDAVENV